MEWRVTLELSDVGSCKHGAINHCKAAAAAATAFVGDWSLGAEETLQFSGYKQMKLVLH